MMMLGLEAGTSSIKTILWHMFISIGSYKMLWYKKNKLLPMDRCNFAQNIFPYTMPISKLLFILMPSFAISRCLRKNSVKTANSMQCPMFNLVITFSHHLLIRLINILKRDFFPTCGLRNI